MVLSQNASPASAAGVRKFYPRIKVIHQEPGQTLKFRQPSVGGGLSDPLESHGSNLKRCRAPEDTSAPGQADRCRRTTITIHHSIPLERGRSGSPAQSYPAAIW